MSRIQHSGWATTQLYLDLYVAHLEALYDKGRVRECDRVSGRCPARRVASAVAPPRVRVAVINHTNRSVNTRSVS